MSGINRIKVIIVTYNGDQYIERCLDSLLGTLPASQILIVDNHSQDKTRFILSQKYPAIGVIYLSKNSGFAFANNVGMKYCVGDENIHHFLLVNQDTISNQTAIEALAEYANLFNEYAILSPLHLNVENQVDPLFEKFVRDAGLSCAEITGKKSRQPYPVPFINAAYWLISKRFVADFGGFDHLLFPHYGEDNNLCQRMNFHKWKIGILPQVSIIHDRDNTKDYKDEKTIISRHFIHLNTFLADINISFNAFVWVYIKMSIKEIVRLFILLFSLKFKQAGFDIKLIVCGKALNFFRVYRSRKINKNSPKYWLESIE